MSDYSSLKATINANVKANNNHEITGVIMNSVLTAMVNSLGAGYQFMGVATPTNPGSDQNPDYKCFYLATTPGRYSHLGGLVVDDGEVALLKWDTSWVKVLTGIATKDQVDLNTEEILKIKAILPQVVTGRVDTYAASVGATFVGNVQSADDSKCVCRAEVFEGEVFKINSSCSTPYLKQYVITDENDVVTRVGTGGTNVVTEITIQPGEKYLYVNLYLYDGKVNYFNVLHIPIAITLKECADLQESEKALENNVNSAYLREIKSWDDFSVKQGKYINGDGTIYESQYRWLSEFVKVKPRDTISCSSMKLNIGGADCYGIACYDKDKKFIPNAGLKGSINNFSGSFVVPDNCMYIRVSDAKENVYARFSIKELGNVVESFNNIFWDEKEILEKRVVSTLRNKKIAVFGDSTFAIAGNESGKWKTIPYFLRYFSGAEVDNFAIGGTGLNTIHSDGVYQYLDFPALKVAIDNNDFTNQIAAAQSVGGYVVDVINAMKDIDLSTYDIFIFGYGANDYTAGITLEAMKTAVETAIQWLYSKNPNITIVVNLPFYRMWNSPTDFVDDTYTHRNVNNNTLAEFSEAMKESVKKFGLSCLSNYDSTGWNYYNRNKYFPPSDGAHFNKVAAREAAKRLFDLLNNLGLA